MTATAASSSTRRRIGLLLIAAAQFMVIMDTSIIGVALPRMQADLGFSPEGLSWVFNAYVVAFGGLLLLGGRLSDLFGARRLFSAGWVVLLGGSVLAGAATTAGWELAGRAIQGAGAALIAPAALTLLMMLFGSEPRELTKALAFYGAAAPAGGTAGVFLGGVITEYISWPWVFYLNVPIALAILAATPAVMPAGGRRRGSVDAFGALTVTGGLALAVYGIVQAPDAGWLATTAVIPTLGTALSAARPEEGGLAAGIVNTSYQVGSALGLAAIAVLAAGQGADRLGDLTALTSGYSAAFVGAAAIAAVGAVIAAVTLRIPRHVHQPDPATSAA